MRLHVQVLRDGSSQPQRFDQTQVQPIPKPMWRLEYVSLTLNFSFVALNSIYPTQIGVSQLEKTL